MPTFPPTGGVAELPGPQGRVEAQFTHIKITDASLSASLLPS